MPILKRKKEDFFKKWSSEMAYVLGFIYADGSVVTNKRGGEYLEFISTDLELIEKIKKIIGSQHQIGVRKPKKSNWRESYRLQIGSTRWVHQLANFGVVQNKSLTVRLPDIPAQYLGDFVRGYFDGDGCVHLGYYRRSDRGTYRWVFSTRFISGSKLFLVDLFDVLKSTVSGGQLLTKNRGYELVFSTHDSLALFRFMYHNVPSVALLERKRKVFERAFQMLHLGP